MATQERKAHASSRADGQQRSPLVSAPAGEYTRLEALVTGQGRVLELISQGAALPTILEALTRWVEEQSRHELLASVLLMDRDGCHLLRGAAPSLPEEYNQAIDHLAIGPSTGSCGTAAFTKEPVIVEDIATDPLWDDFRHLALPHGLRACWSMPLLGNDGTVLGTFAIYYRRPRAPAEDDFQLIRLVSRTAVLAIEHARAEAERAELLASEQRARRQVEAERQRIQGLLMQAPAMITVLRGPEHVFELANPLYMRAVGMDREIVGKPIRQALPELEGQGFFELLDRVYTTGEPYYGNELLVRLDRTGHGALEDRYFNFVYQPSRSVSGDIDGILVHAVDVTDLVESRRLAEESERRFRLLADNMSQFAWMADGTGSIFWYNQRWYDYTGTTLDEMRGWGWKAVHHPDHVERVVAKISACFQSGEVWEDTFPLRGKDGAYRWFLSRAIPIHDAHGTVIRWFGTNTDITRQRELEQEKDGFIAIASHELKTPVASLKLYAQALGRQFRKAGDERTAQLLEKMDGQLNKLTSLITDLLDVTKIEGGKLQMQVTTFEYGDLVREVVEEVQRTATRHTIEVADIPAPLTLTGDRDRIGQVLTNLLTNAVKYSPQADKVLVDVAPRDGAVITSVRDFGIGIPRAKRPHVFERFFRVGGDEQAATPGLGLGLYISAEIVKRHHGRIWVGSEDGQGSTFAFALPAAPSVPVEG